MRLALLSKIVAASLIWWLVSSCHLCKKEITWIIYLAAILTWNGQGSDQTMISTQVSIQSQIGRRQSRIIGRPRSFWIAKSMATVVSSIGWNRSRLEGSRTFLRQKTWRHPNCQLHLLARASLQLISRDNRILRLKYCWLRRNHRRWLREWWVARPIIGRQFGCHLTAACNTD